MKTFTDFIHEINLFEFAFVHGYRQDVSKGRKWAVLVNKAIDDTIIIGNATTQQYYFNPLDENDKGTLIQFVRNRLGVLFADNSLKKQAENINAVLYAYLKLPPPEKGMFELHRKEKTIVFESALLKPFTNTNYLVNKRGIRLDILRHELFAGTIKQMLQQQFINTAFPYTDMNETLVGAELCNKGFKAHAAGSNRSAGIWHSNILSSTKNIVIAESGIDALSYHQLKGNAENLYISVGGNLTQGQLNTISALAKKINASTIIGAFDNDVAGKKFCELCRERFENFVADAPTGKDFNEELTSVSNNISSGI
jgi:hypothetical protein